MNRLRLYLLALTALIVCSAKADEGMWLLQLMQQQHSIDMMKKQGLKLEAQDLYNPNGVSLKDAVGIFGGGCTGEIISPEGLILTNHHYPDQHQWQWQYYGLLEMQALHLKRLPKYSKFSHELA